MTSTLQADIEGKKLAKITHVDIPGLGIVKLKKEMPIGNGDPFEGIDVITITDDQDEEELMRAEEKILDEYMTNAYNGTDDDWAMSDQHRSAQALLKIAAAIRIGILHEETLSEIRGIIYDATLDAARDHIRAIKDSGRIL